MALLVSDAQAPVEWPELTRSMWMSSLQPWSWGPEFKHTQSYSLSMVQGIGTLTVSVALVFCWYSQSGHEGGAWGLGAYKVSKFLGSGARGTSPQWQWL